MWTLRLISQVSSGSGTSNPWAQLGIASIVCATWFLVAYTLWQENRQLRKESSELQTKRIEDRDAQMLREQDRAERIIPLLQQAAELLARAPERFDRALGQAQSASRSTEVDLLIRRMEEAVERVNRERGGL